jgi:hypothetical protein
MKAILSRLMWKAIPHRIIEWAKAQWRGLRDPVPAVMRLLPIHTVRLALHRSLGARVGKHKYPSRLAMGRFFEARAQVEWAGALRAAASGVRQDPSWLRNREVHVILLRALAVRVGGARWGGAASDAGSAQAGTGGGRPRHD